MLKSIAFEKYYLPKKTLELFNSIPNINLEITSEYIRVLENHSPAIVSKELWYS